MLLRTSLKYSSPILFTQDEDLIDGISEWKENDVIYAKGFLATKEVEKKAICPHCGAVNLRREACQAESVRSGGNMIYFSPIFAEILPLTLEEIFINETEVVGYDIKKIIF